MAALKLPAGVATANSITPRSKSKGDHNNIFKLIYPVYILSRIFGLLPFSMGLNSRKTCIWLRVNVIDFIWFVTSIVIYAGFTGYLFTMPLSASLPYDSYIMKIGGILILISGYLMAIISIIADMINRKKILKILRLFHDFDCKVGSCGSFIA